MVIVECGIRPLKFHTAIRENSKIAHVGDKSLHLHTSFDQSRGSRLDDVKESIHIGIERA